MFYLRWVFLAVSLTTPITANAELLSSDPETVCAWLDDQGLAGRKWTDYGDGTAGCASNYRDIGRSAYLPNNNIAYYVLGEGETVHQVKLMLNVNNPALQSEAKRALLAASADLVMRAAGQQIPGSISEAITEGLYWSQRVGSSTVKVERIGWSNGQGFEIQVVLK